jgi:predicted dehydrogenase
MPVRVAVIGSGWADRVLIPAFQAAGLAVVALAGRHRGKTEAAAARHGVAVAVVAWRALLELDVDLVAVVTPPASHVEIGTAVLDAGKHLLIEKPLAVDVAGAQALATAARRHPDLVALVDHQLRMLPARRKARELLAGGAIGEPLVITARVAMDDRIDPTAPWSWWSDAGQGGGMLNAIGSHVLDGIRWLLPDSELRLGGATLGVTYPERTDASGERRRVSADDIASLSFAAGGAVGTALVHGAALDGAVDLLTIRGTAGTLVIDRSLKLYLGARDSALKGYRVQLPDVVPNRFRASGFAAGTVLLGEAIGRAIGDGDTAALAGAATVEDGLAVQTLLDEARGLAAQRHGASDRLG